MSIHKREIHLLSIVVPCYKNELNFPSIYDEIIKHLGSLEKYNLEIIFINDGSPDKTWDKIQAICEKDKRVRGISLSRNFGHQGALTAGLDVAQGELVVSMDCDLQDPPELVLEMLKQWEEGYEIVYARRKNRNDTFLKKYTAILYYKILSKISDTEIPRNVGDFRLIDKKVLEVFKTLKEKDRYIRGMFSWLGFKTGFVDFNRPERTLGESSYTWKKMWKLASDGILNFSTFPLKIGAFIGMFMILLSIIFFFYMIVGTITVGELMYYQLYKWISVVGFGFMGLQFIFMWILGEYIGRIYNETRERPIYIIREKINI